MKTGKVRYALLDLPLESIHKLAFKASEATHCAGDQGKYWEMHDRLFNHQRQLEPWSGHAEAVGLDTDKFESCMEDGKHANAIRAMMAEASKVRITGTPGFVIGKTDPSNPNKVTGLTFLRGAQAFPTFKQQLDQALAQAE